MPTFEERFPWRAYYGVEGIPKKWRHKLAGLHVFERFGLALMKHSW